MLVEGVDSNPRSAAIVRSIVALCHGLGLQVIAEGVERPAQLEFLSHCGPIGVQGYLLAYPVETQDAEKEAQAAAARARSILQTRQLAKTPAVRSRRPAQLRWCSSAAGGCRRGRTRRARSVSSSPNRLFNSSNSARSAATSFSNFASRSSLRAAGTPPPAAPTAPALVPGAT